MSDSIIVDVIEPEIDVIVIGEGVTGRRGPMGLKGDKGDPGLRGPEGPMGKDLVVIPTTEAVINITPDNHGDFYISLHDINSSVYAVLGSTTITEEGVPVDTSGAASFFTQATEAELNVIGLDETVTIIVPKEKLPKAYGIGSTIGVVSRGENTWVLFGDLLNAEVILDELSFNYYFQEEVEPEFNASFYIRLLANGELVGGEEVEWNWALNDVAGNETTQYNPLGLLVNYGENYTLTITATRTNGQFLTLELSGIVE